ncbi:MAG TPA: IS1595 family transposase [Caulobacteraceae bacterium]
MPVNERGQERQHFLLTSAACDLSEKAVARMSEDEAYAAFEAIRFADQDGVPFCPKCETPNAYRLTINRCTKFGVAPTRLYKCRACRRQFSVTSGTIFSSRKMTIPDILYALIVFVDAVSGEAALRLRRALGCSYKTSFVLEGKLREAILLSRSKRLLHGVIEVDGTEIGGHSRKGRLKEKGKETRVGAPSALKTIVAIRERRPDGETRVAIFGHESHYRDPVAGTDFIRDNVVFGSTMISDEGFSLGYIGPHKTIKHKAGYQIDGIHSNGVEGFFARVKRAEDGVYYRMVGDNIDLYAHECSWREDYRRKSNGDQWKMLIAAVTKAPASRRWAGYWQRWQAPDAPRRNRVIPCAPRPC